MKSNFKFKTLWRSKVINKIIVKSKYNFEYVDLGGGIGIDYSHDNKKFNLKNTQK